jgi:hypothetical protein
MIRRLAIAFVLVLVVLPVAASAQDEGQETGSVRGVVSNGTEDGEDVAGLEVELLRFEAMDVAEEFSTAVADDGSYEFTDLPINQGEAYLATVNYEGVEFRSGMILLTQEPDAERDITIYEQTDDRSVLRIISRGVVIAGADPDTGMIDILEIIALENESDRVFVGDEQGQVLRLAMPQDASAISPQPGFDFGQMHFDGDVLVSTGAVIPGSHNPMISYQIPYEGTSGTLNIGTAMETGTLRVLVQEDTFNLSSQVLEPAGQAQVGSDNYDVLAVDRPVVGDSFSVRISGLPRENWNLPMEMSTFLASIAAGVGLVIGTVLIYQVVQRRRLVPGTGTGAGEVPIGDMSADELEKERIELASELNNLESDYERGDLDEETYQAERDEILQELRQISLRMRGLEDSD